MAALDFWLGVLLVALAITVLAVFVDWLLNRQCKWCHEGPATLAHYLERHSANGDRP